MNAQPARASFGIGEVLAQLRGEFPDVSVSKIRFLESEGLIQPARSPSEYRRFGPADVERLRYILTAQRDEYLPLRVIKDRLAAAEDDAGDDPEGPPYRRGRGRRRELLDAAGIDDELPDRTGRLRPGPALRTAVRAGGPGCRPDHRRARPLRGPGAAPARRPGRRGARDFTDRAGGGAHTAAAQPRVTRAGRADRPGNRGAVAAVARFADGQCPGRRRAWRRTGWPRRPSPRGGRDRRAPGAARPAGGAHVARPRSGWGVRGMTSQDSPARPRPGPGRDRAWPGADSRRLPPARPGRPPPHFRPARVYVG